ncbi:FAD-binding protein [candidate division KSB1 bacterium]|nr:FAD-binding protein [candidate division KSB1 bacterium]
MEKSTIQCHGLEIPVFSVNTVIVGSGAAALKCADQLHSLGQTDLAMVTEKIGGGTSNNTGSDKQTYYKLSVFGKEPDSPFEMARSLFDGGAMHGDLALIEAILSPQAFFHLAQIGVQFPINHLGGYVGYKTDHDPRQRATSAGPYTSQQMVQCLLQSVRQRQIQIFDAHEVIALLRHENRVIGLLALDTSQLENEHFGLVLFHAQNVVFGVGGPGGLYQTSVYPACHLGAIGLALEIGAEAANLTESQYGLASTKFRWNVSGTYQQVIPRYISRTATGADAQEFLNPYFQNIGQLTTDIFLKGYQWPFDPRKLANYGSSLIDVLVYLETVVRGRRVFMDFRENPRGDARLGAFQFDTLRPEAYQYLQNSQALFGTPIERLAKMNPLAIELYRRNGIDLYTEPLEVAVCAQHNNGGLKGDIWWESNIRHLFPVGEVNGSHGVYRPGGSALNSGQVGAIRAAQRIANVYQPTEIDLAQFQNLALPQLEKYHRLIQHWLEGPATSSDLDHYRQEFQARLSRFGAHIRNLEQIKLALPAAQQQAAQRDQMRLARRAEIPIAFQNRHLVLAHLAYLTAIQAYLENQGGSRGSYLVLDPTGAQILPEFGAEWRYKVENPELRNWILETSLDARGQFTCGWTERRPIPQPDDWFENVWADFRSKKIFQKTRA